MFVKGFEILANNVELFPNRERRALSWLIAKDVFYLAPKIFRKRTQLHLKARIF